MGYKVLASHSSLLNDRLSVIQYKSAHSQQSQVDLGVPQDGRTEENIGQTHQHQTIQQSKQNPSQVKPLSAVGENRADRKRNKDHASRYKGGDNNAGIHQHDVFQ